MYEFADWCNKRGKICWAREQLNAFFIDAANLSSFFKVRTAGDCIYARFSPLGVLA
jgi:hypothetical protein